MEDGFARKKGPIKAYLEGRHTCSFVSRHFVTRMDAGEPENTTLKVETNFFSPSLERLFQSLGGYGCPWDRMERKMEMFGVRSYSFERRAKIKEPVIE